MLKALFVVLFVIVTYLSVAPNPPGGASGNPLTWWLSALFFGDLAYADKIGHFLAYAALAGVFTLARFVRGRAAVIGVLALAAYGGVLELVQGRLMSRSMESLDALANALGVFAAYPAALGLLAVMRRATGPRRATETGAPMENGADRTM